MNPSPCGHCGMTVMPYRKYLLYSSSKATCQACGEEVRLRGWNGLLLIAGLMLLLLVATLLFTQEISTFGVVTGGLAVIALALDRWSWQVLPWDPVPEEDGPRSR